MKARGAAVQGALAAVGLLAAYFTWQRPAETRTNDNVVVLEATKSQIEALRFEDGTRFIELTRVVVPEPTVWLKQGFLEGKEPKPPAVDAGTLADGGVPFAPPPPPPVVTAPRDLKGNERAEKLFERFTPFEASRALGVLPGEKLKELGLEGSERNLTITLSGSPRRFAVGTPGTSVIGTYLKDTKDQKVYLVQGSLISEFDTQSQALVERRLHAFKPSDFDTFVVTTEGKTAEFIQTGADIPQTTKVTPKDAPDKPDEFVRNWHDKVWSRLIVTEVYGRGEAPKGGEPKVVVRVDYLLKGKPKGFVELGRYEDGTAFARSELTASWVALHIGGDDTFFEARKVVGLP
jgi:hypothetical protein